jgi:tetratricopeptide (TPR) repeat protein
MSSLPDWFAINREYERYTYQRLQETNQVILFGNVLYTIGSDYICAMEYFHRLLRTLPFDHIDRSDVYYNLGRIYILIEKYQKALACYQCAVLLLRRMLPQRICDYCRALSGTGTVYLQTGDLKRAINCLERALILELKGMPGDHVEIPFLQNSLAYAYFTAKRFDDALTILTSADHFFRTRILINHHGHAQTIHIKGLIYLALSDDKQAYRCFEEALRKREWLLPKDHPDIACTCYELSLIHESLHEYECALDYANKSLQIRSIKLPHYHSDLKRSVELVERLQRQQQISHTD